MEGSSSSGMSKGSIAHSTHRHTGVCGKNTPEEKKTFGRTGFQSTKSERGEQCLSQDCGAKAPIKGMICLTLV